MFYIATVHYNTNQWLHIQRRFIEKYLNDDYFIFYSIESLKFNISIDKNIFVYQHKNLTHGEKLNYLAKKIIEISKRENDIMIFMDGDAFPINYLAPIILEKIRKYQLVAIQRIENFGDAKPHPSFCAITIKLWKELEGDWRKGYRYRNRLGEEITDVGSRIYYKLLKNKIKWAPLLRSNKKNIHPIFYGVYENLIYHHGAGFRRPFSKIDYYNIRKEIEKKKMNCKLFKKILEYKFKKEKIKENLFMSNFIFSMIKDNSDFYKMFFTQGD